MVNKVTSPVPPLGLVDVVNQIIDDKQDNLVSGTNIKTINNTSLLGQGNINITISGLTANRALASNANGDVVVSSVTSTELGYLSGVTSAIQTQLDNRANTDLSNLSPTGEAHFANPALTNSSYTTNRILEIPQDINLELNNGTLTLKAGSKVYVPNGFEEDGVTPKFDVVTVQSDFTKATYGSAVQTLLCFNTSDMWLEDAYTGQCYSGTVAPTAAPYMIWYDTASNLVKRTNDGGSTWTSGFSLPIGLVTSTTTTYSSIDQIFNGFGYIGSTVFVLPGVKVQQATGFDGNTPTSEIQTITSIGVVQSAGNNNFYDVYMRYTDSGLFNRNAGHLSFDADRNLVIDNDYPSAARGIVLYSYSTDSTGKIKTFNPTSTDFVANTNASNFSQAGRSYLSGLGATNPSKYENVTLLASGQPYTAPANGYFVLSAMAANAGTYVGFYGGCFVGSYANANSYVRITTPLIKKGNSVRLEYTGTITVQSFLFFYADGEE